MLISNEELQKQAMLAIVQQMHAQQVDLAFIAEGAKLRLLGSPQLCMMPAEFRVRCANAVDELINEALAQEEGGASDRP